VLGVLSAAPALAYLHGFTVDDAFIPARYAANLAHGFGYRFNAHGPSTDGVTALGYAHLLAPFAGQEPLSALRAARVLGAASWLVAAGVLGAAIAAIAGSRARYAAFCLVLFSAPLGAWAVAGLDTGLVLSLATVAAALPARPRYAPWGAALAGAVAALRPEMVAWAAVLARGRGVARPAAARAVTLSLSLLPWCAVAAIRAWLFGRPAPLAVLAKPSDIEHGLAYVLPNMVLTGAPLAALAPLMWFGLGSWPRHLLLAGFVHLAVVALAGGDWMPLARLFTPVLPGLTLVVAHQLAAPVGRLFGIVGLALGGAGQLWLFAVRGPSASHVLRDRLALIEQARAPLAGANRVATVDVGWVGAATNAEIIDLAGATDPEIAALPGGHTSKAVSGALLTGRAPDRLVFQLAPARNEQTSAPRYARAIEQRLAADPLVIRSYEPAWESPSELPIRYDILSLRP
jgi:hypothetical protein